MFKLRCSTPRDNLSKVGVEYSTLPVETDVPDGMGPALLHVGQIKPDTEVLSPGLPAVFTPCADGKTVIGESRDVKVTFSAITICIQSNSWRVAEEDPESGRRLIATAGEASYFTINSVGTAAGIYELARCPTESCPYCRPRCGPAGLLVRDGKRLLALDGSPVYFPFLRRN